MSVVVCIAPILMFPLIPSLGWAEGSVWTAESSYNLVRVVRVGAQVALQLNHPSSIHTVRDTGSPWTGYYYDFFALGPRLVRSRRALVLGMGGGSSIRSMRQAAPAIDVDAVEIDPKVVSAAVQWFGVDPGDRALHVHVADARRWLSRSRSTYDLMQLDVYQGGPYIPFYLVTEEFFRLARDHMNGDALLMMNVFDQSRDRNLLFAIAATLRREFPTVMTVQTDPSNFMLLAFTRSRGVAAIRQELVGAWPGIQISEIVPAAGTPIFTDDRAPVEAMTRRMLGGR